MSEADEIAALFRRDLTRVIQQLQAFPVGPKLWDVAPGITNSAGNLILHLEGNLREFIGRQLGSLDYQRKRDEEFLGRGVNTEELVARMQSVREMVTHVTASLTTEAMEARYPEVVLGTELSTRQFLIHLLGHLNYHLGQIDYLRRILTGGGSVSYAGL